MYVVTEAFTDTRFGGIYFPGETYPGKGTPPTEEWVEYLLSNRNKFGRPIIELKGKSEDDGELKQEAVNVPVPQAQPRGRKAKTGAEGNGAS